MDALLDRQLLGPMIMLGGFSLVFASYALSGLDLRRLKKTDDR